MFVRSVFKSFVFDLGSFCFYEFFLIRTSFCCMFSSLCVFVYFLLVVEWAWFSEPVPHWLPGNTHLSEVIMCCVECDVGSVHSLDIALATGCIGLMVIIMADYLGARLSTPLPTLFSIIVYCGLFRPNTTRGWSQDCVGSPVLISGTCFRRLLTHTSWVSGRSTDAAHSWSVSNQLR